MKNGFAKVLLYTFNVSTMLYYLKNYPNENLSLLLLSYKCAMLLALFLGKRGQIFI